MVNVTMKLIEFTVSLLLVMLWVCYHGYKSSCFSSCYVCCRRRRRRRQDALTQMKRKGKEYTFFGGVVMRYGSYILMRQPPLHSCGCGCRCGWRCGRR